MENLNDIFAWINANPAWGGLGVFLIAFFESLAMVGLILPGAAMMFGIGALVGTDVLPLGPTLLWAGVGAIAGDGVSFWLGRHYHMQLKTMWPLRKHPELIANATQFFYRHGGKSILFGRFIGPIRPVIPAVAGMLEMPTRRFLQFNILSGILWAPVYVLPGMIFTTSLGLAAEVASRLAVMVGSLLAMAVLVLWLSRLGFNRLHRFAYPLLQRTLIWSRLHPVAGRIPASLLDPEQPEARGLTWMALLLLLATLLFSTLVASLGEAGGLLAGLDNSLQHTLQHMRTPTMDRLMLTASRLGDLEVVITLFVVIFGWLWWRGLRRAALHWLAALALGWLLGGALHALLDLDHTLLLDDIAAYGFVAVLIARELPVRHRWWVYALPLLLLLTIAFARLYLGIEQLSSLLGAFTLGSAWVALLGIGYRHHPAERVAPLSLALISLVVIGLTMAWHGPYRLQEELDRYRYHEETVPTSRSAWFAGELSLPAYRADLRGRHRHPLNLHYLGPLPVLEDMLTRAGWGHPPEVDALSWLQWLNPDNPLQKMPVLPQVHDGRYHELLLTQELDGRWLAIRLWRSHYLAGSSGDPLWLGSISELKVENLGGLNVPRTQPDFAAAAQAALGQLKGLEGLEVDEASGTVRLTPVVPGLDN
ncbi:MAG: VTT domain-containing protein [Chromatiales bacterium]|nr:VTT domain-containing protein [Chromatiales bacterium]